MKEELMLKANTVFLKSSKKNVATCLWKEQRKDLMKICFLSTCPMFPSSYLTLVRLSSKTTLTWLRNFLLLSVVIFLSSTVLPYSKPFHITLALCRSIRAFRQMTEAFYGLNSTHCSKSTSCPSFSESLIPAAQLQFLCL